MKTTTAKTPNGVTATKKNIYNTLKLKKMILAFKPQFVEKIKNGSKIHTIREDKPERWKPGQQIHFATGVRSKNYNCFLKGNCISTQNIMILPDEQLVKIDLDFLRAEKIHDMAINDGFDSVIDFFNFFKSKKGFFSGKIIHWTNHKYSF